MTVTDKSSIADLVAEYGSSSATAWLEFDRYKIWRPTEPVPESSFLPVQGYMEKAPYVFAWGNPLVSDSAALPAVARQFLAFCEEQGARPVWSCVDRDLEEVLGGPEFDWCTVSCIYEDVVDPANVVELTAPEAKGTEGQHVVKDLRKNLGRAEKYDVKVEEVLSEMWSEADKRAVEKGIEDWKANKSGVQIASTTMEPWLDSGNRRYWVARKDNEPVGILILAPIQSASWQIKNAVSFPSAPKGTSEALIYTALKDLHAEQEAATAKRERIPHPANGNTDTAPIPGESPGHSGVHPPASVSASSSSVDISETPSDASTPISTPSASTPSVNEDANAKADGDSKTNSGPVASTTHHRDADRVTVTFGISAAPDFTPVRNLGGWKVKALGKTYGKVASGAKLVQRGEFRSKFDSEADPMYVCYPADGFGLEGVNALLKVLRK